MVAKGGYENVIGLSTSLGKDVIPRSAGQHLAQPIGDIIEISVRYSVKIGRKHLSSADLRWQRSHEGQN